MQIVPVLDIKNGRVVRGVGGRREAYRPIETPLAAGSDPAAVALGLDALEPAGGFPDFYVADLDAIAGSAPDAASLDALAAVLPGRRFWVDAGLTDAAGAHRLLARPEVVAVIGTETLREAREMAVLKDHPRVVLSLDFRGEAPVGDPALFAGADLWPGRVIAMTLARVGSGTGPDLDRLAAVKALAGGARAVYAAGGVRGPDELPALPALGVAGALVSTALHTGKVLSENIR